MLVKEYAELMRVTVQSVTKRLKRNNPPPGIKSWRMFGGTYDLEIDIDELYKAATKKLKKEVA